MSTSTPDSYEQRLRDFTAAVGGDLSKIKAALAPAVGAGTPQDQLDALTALKKRALKRILVDATPPATSIVAEGLFDAHVHLLKNPAPATAPAAPAPAAAVTKKSDWQNWAIGGMAAAAILLLTGGVLYLGSKICTTPSPAPAADTTSTPNNTQRSTAPTASSTGIDKVNGKAVSPDRSVELEVKGTNVTAVEDAVLNFRDKANVYQPKGTYLIRIGTAEAVISGNGN